MHGHTLHCTAHTTTLNTSPQPSPCSVAELLVVLGKAFQVWKSIFFWWKSLEKLFPAPPVLPLFWKRQWQSKRAPRAPRTKKGGRGGVGQAKRAHKQWSALEQADPSSPSHLVSHLEALEKAQKRCQQRLQEELQKAMDSSPRPRIWESPRPRQARERTGQELPKPLGQPSGSLGKGPEKGASRGCRKSSRRPWILAQGQGFGKVQGQAQGQGKPEKGLGKVQGSGFGQAYCQAQGDG